MRELDHPLDRGGRLRSADPDLEPRRTSGAATAIWIVIAVLLGAAGWFGLRKWSSTQATLPVAGSRESVAAPTAAGSAPPAAPLPPLDASDALVRELAATLSAHPRLASWLVDDDLARRFVGAVVNVAEGTSPATQLRILKPSGDFRAGASGDGWFVEPASFHRYDPVTDVFTSIDPARAAELFRRLHPLFDAAYAELGDPNSSFDRTFAAAIDRLLAVPIPEVPVALVPQGGQFAFADHGIEERTVAEKHLLRLGPENARRVQEKLRALAPALGLRSS